MKTKNILYWICTILFALFMGGTSIPALISPQQSIELFKLLGYPAYLVGFLCVAKILGSIAIVVPGFPRLKEWAYAGLFFDITGATFSMAMTGMLDAAAVGFMLAGYVLFAGSYILYHQRRKSAAGAHLQPAI
ncbi:DoxX family protein [Chitinophaga cymbidii]|uniref:DoxX-like family protein n=1 Tax=Chitinophaga cymbidii TaxID=1096750 RepID=A0A512RLU1_9BACT|nr:DoxX family protein [Chitinophaga cymbidii]GEP96681.1 hypothetical protein CCY01nite_29410 [Chitinophaga cymbidii]